MDFDTKAAHRKSRAPWQSNAVKSNPYANANTLPNEGISNVNPYSTYGNNSASNNVVNNSNTNISSNTLQIPKNQRGVNGGAVGGGPSNAVAGTGASRKVNRRLSIHASAAAAGHGRPTAGGVATSQLYRTTTNQSVTLVMSRVDDGGGAFNPNAKVLGDLSGGTAAEIDDYYKVLTKQQTIVNRDIKDNINENQKNILELTNDLKETQEELLQLRVTTRELYEILDDFKDAAQRRIELENENASIHNALGSMAGTSMRTPSQSLRNGGKRLVVKKKDRSSIIYLEKMWNDQLQSLFKHVEGASKFIQPIPGRHILAESGRWSEVNVGNWKIVKPAHLFILNDVVLVATKKYSSGTSTGSLEATATTPTSSTTPMLLAPANSKSKLQAVFCWPLHEVKFLEVSTPSINRGRDNRDENKTYLVNLKSNSMSYVYQTDRYDHFLKILEAFKKGQHELSQRDRAFEIAHGSEGTSRDSEDKKLLRESLRNSGIAENSDDKRKSISGKRNSAEGLLQDISAKVHSRNRSHDFKNGSPKLGGSNSGGTGQFFNDLKRIEDRIDEVDVEIAHNKYAESAGLIRYIENKISSIESSLDIGISKQSDSGNNSLEDEVRLLIEVINLKINTRKTKIQKSLTFELQNNVSALSGEEISGIMEFFNNLEQLDHGVAAYLHAMSGHLNATASRLVVGVQGSTKIDVVNYLGNLVIIYVSIVRRTISTYKDYISPILAKDPNSVCDSSGLINWCNDEMSRLVIGIKKHLYGTLVSIAARDPITEEPVYQVKDVKLFNEFIGIIKPQLDELKNVGVNFDFLFQDIFFLKYS